MTKTLKTADSLKTAVSGSMPFGTRTVFLGDSEIAGNGNEVETNQADWSVTIPTFAALSSNGRIVRVANSGVAGNTAAQMLARFATDVAAYKPSLVVIMAGTNDAKAVGAPTPLATYAASIEAMVAASKAINAGVVLCTIPPNIGSSTIRAAVTLYNAWLKRYCSQNNIPLWDAYKFFVDPATGDFLVAYQKDGTHPSNAGLSAAGADLAAYLATVGEINPITCLLPQENADPNNLITNGLFLNTTGSGATLKPTGWSLSPSSHTTGVTASIVTGDTAIRGNWWSLVGDGATAAADDMTFVQPAVVAGHLYGFVGRVEASGMRGADSGTGSGWNIGAAFNGTLNNQLYDFRNPASAYYNLNAGAAGAWYHEMLAPSDATTCQIRLILRNTTAGGGTLKIAQIGLYDLTALGLDGSV